MANHVYFYIDMSTDAEQSELVQKLSETCKETNGEHGWHSWNIEQLPIYDTPYEEENWYNWGCENLGAKWVSCEDWNENIICGHSAWSPITPFINNLVQYIHRESGKPISAKMTYEDEFRNFIGVHHCEVDENGTFIEDYEEFEGEDLNQLMLEAFGKDDDWFNSDDFDWWTMFPITKEGHPLQGQEWEPQEYCDELVYNFFSTERLEHVS
jgi:hypothetical protein